MGERFLIIDGLNLFIRTWAVVPTMNSNGEHVGGVVGFLRSLKAMVREIGPSEVVVVWDGPGGSQKRRGVFAEYKAGRKPRVNRQYDFETPQQSEANLKMQYGKVRQFLDMLGVVQMEIENVEADDAIAFLCHGILPETEKVVVSTDKDLLQLVDYKTLVYSPVKKIYYTAKILKESFGVLAENFVYFKAMLGDGSDNIKGIRGIGEKTAVKLFPMLADHPTNVEEIIAHAETNKDKSPKFRSLLDNRDVLIDNVHIMQLSTPIIGASAIAQIRYAFEKDPSFCLSELKLSLIRDGIQLTDIDFFHTFKEYQMKMERTGRRGAKQNVAD